MHGTPDSSQTARFRVNSIGMMNRLAVLNLGIAALAEKIVADDVASDRLRRVMPEWEASRIPVYAVPRPDCCPPRSSAPSTSCRNACSKSNAMGDPAISTRFTEPVHWDSGKDCTSDVRSEH